MTKTTNSLTKATMALLVTGLLGSASANAASTVIWTNNASNSLLSTTPWSNSPTLTSGDSWFFANTSGVTLTNDFAAGYLVNGITFNSGTGVDTINGNSINLSGGITNNSTSLQTLGTAFVLQASQTITSKSGGGKLLFNGAFSDGGAGYGLTFNGTGTSTLATNNTFTGSTIVNGGGLIMTNATAGGVSLAGALTVTNTGYLSGFTYTSVNANSNITVSSTNGLAVGQFIAGNNIPAGASITGISNTTVTLSVNATGSGSSISGSVFTSAGTVKAYSATLTNLIVAGNANSYGGSGVNSANATGTANFVASNSTVNGAMSIAGPASGTPYMFANYVAGSLGSNYGYAQFYGPMVVTNLTVNGRLDLLGNGSMSLSGITGSSNGQTAYTGGGSGVITLQNSYTNANTNGGYGSVLNFVGGSVFAGLIQGTVSNSMATFTESGNGTVTLGAYQGSYNGAPAGANAQNYTFSGGNWFIGQLGQGNSGQQASGTNSLVNGANVIIATNGSGNSGGTWQINSGAMTFLGNTAVSGSLNNFGQTFGLVIGSSGTLTINGTFNESGKFTNTTYFLTNNGGKVNITNTVSVGGLGANITNLANSMTFNSGTNFLGNNLTIGFNGYNPTTNTTIATNNGTTTNTISYLTNSGLIAVQTITSTNTSNTPVPVTTNLAYIGNITNTVTLAGGVLAVNGTLSAGSGVVLGSYTNITGTNSGSINSFSWSGGTLSAGTINATGTNWNGANSSIANSTLSNTNGTLWVGNVTNGYAGSTTITGNYNASGGSTTTFNIFGTNKSSTWAGGTNNYSQLTVSSNAILNGTLVINFGSYSPVAGVGYNLITATNITGTYTPVYNGGNFLNVNGLLFGTDGFSYFGLTNSGTVLSFTNLGQNQWSGASSVWNTADSSWTGINPTGTNLGAFFGSLGQGGLITVQGSQTVSSLGFSSSTNSYILSDGGSSTITINNGNGNPVMITNSAGSNSVASAISIGGNLSVKGSGTLTLSGTISDGGNGYSVLYTNGGLTTLSGSNSYSGGTTIGAGTVSFTSTSAFGTEGVTNKASLLYADAGTVSLDNTLSGTGSLTVNGAGTLSLNGTYTYSGATLVSNGTLSLNGTNSGSGTVSIAGGTFNEGSSGAIIGNNAMSVSGNAVVNLAGSNTLGAVTVNSGTVNYQSSAALASNSALTVNNGGTLNFTNSGTIANLAGTTNTNAGSITLNAGSIMTVSNGATVSYNDKAYNFNGNRINVNGGSLTVGNGGTIAGTNLLGSRVAIGGGGLISVQNGGSLNMGTYGATIGLSLGTNILTNAVGGTVVMNGFYMGNPYGSGSGSSLNEILNSGTITNGTGNNFTIGNDKAGALASTNLFLNYSSGTIVGTNAAAVPVTLGNNSSLYNLFSNAGTASLSTLIVGNNSNAPLNIVSNSGTMTLTKLQIGGSSTSSVSQSAVNTISITGGVFSNSGTTTLGAYAVSNNNTIDVEGGQATLGTVTLGAAYSQYLNAYSNGTSTNYTTNSQGVVTTNVTATYGTNSVAATANSNTVLLGGGTLSVTQFLAGAGSAAAGDVNSIQFNGGTLQAATNSSNNFLSAGVATVTLNANGGTVNSATTNLTIGAPVTGVGGLKVGSGTLILANASYYGGTTVTNGSTLIVQSGALGSGDLNVKGSFSENYTNSTTLGAISGTGTISLTGSGSLTLGSATNDFSGSLTLNNGTLVVNNGVTLTSASVNVNNGTIAGTGSLGSATLSNSVITAGGGTLSFNNLTLTGGGSYNWNLFSAGNGQSSAADLISVKGVLNLASQSNAFGINLVTNNSTVWDTTQNAFFTILTAGSINGFNAAKFSAPNIANTTGRFSVGMTNNSIVLYYTAAGQPIVLFSDAGSSQNLASADPYGSVSALATNDTTTPVIKGGGGELVLDGQGGVATNFGGNLTIGSGTVTVATNVGGLGNMGNIAIGSTSSEYAGSNAVLNLAASGLSNNAGISVSGTGTSSIVNSSGGTVVLTGPVTLSTNLVISSTSPSGSLLLAGVVNGSGSLAVSGTGTLVLNAANTYGGGTTLNGMTLALGSSSALGSGTLSVLSPSVLKAGAANLSVGTQVVVSGGSKVTLDSAGNALTASALITGQGSVGVTDSTGSGTITLSGANNYAGGTTVNGGVLNVTTNTALGTGSVTVYGGTLRQQVSNALTVPVVAGGNGNLDLNSFAYAVTNTTLLGSGTLNVLNNSKTTVNGPSAFAGTLSFGNGTVTVTTNGSIANGTVAIGGAGAVLTNFGSIGTVFVNGNGSTNSTVTTTTNAVTLVVTTNYNASSTGSANLIASNSSMGSVVIAGPSTNYTYYAANMAGSAGTNAGYAQFQNGVSVGNLTVNGRLDIGNGTFSLPTISGTANAPGATNYVGGGAGVIAYNSTNANTLGFTSGSAFMGFWITNNAVATLTQSGAGTTSFGLFGYGSAGVGTNASITFNGGNWAIGQFGQNNSGAVAFGNYTLTNGAAITVGGNAGAGGPTYTHGNFFLNNGAMTFNGVVAQSGDANPTSLANTLNFTVGSSGTLTINGYAQLGVATAGTVVNPSSITVNGGLVNISNYLVMGNSAGTGAKANTNDVINVTVNAGTLNVGANGIIVGYNNTAGVAVNETSTLSLNGGKIVSAGTIYAPTSVNPTSSIASSFVWTAGQLTAATITASNTNWIGAGSSITGNTLYNSNGLLAPGDLGVAGRTTINGSYVQSGGSSRLALDLGGINQANAFTNGPTNGGYYDYLSISGGRAVFSNTTIALSPNWYALGNGATQLSLVTGATNLVLTNVTYNWTGGATGATSVSADNAIAVTVTNSGNNLVANVSLNQWTNGKGNWGSGGTAVWTRGVDTTNGANSFASFGNNAAVVVDQDETVHAVSFLGTNNTVTTTNGSVLTLASTDSNGVIVNNTTGANTLATPIALQDNLRLIGNGYLNLSGGVSGTFGVTSAGNGAGNNSYVMALTGSNSYSGATIVSSGAFQTTYNPNSANYTVAAGANLIAIIAGANGWGDSNLSAVASGMSNATLSFDATGTNYTVNTSIFTNVASSLKLGTYGNGTVSLVNGADYTAVKSFMVNGGTFDLGGNTLTNYGATFNSGTVVSGTIVANTTTNITGTNTASFVGNGTATVAANLSGNAGFTSSGGYITLMGTNTYTGATVLSGGILRTVLNPASTYITTNNNTTFIATVAGPNGNWTGDMLSGIAAQMTNSTLGIDGDITLSDITNVKGGITVAAYSGTATLDASKNNTGIAKISLNGGNLNLGGSALTLSGVTLAEGTLNNGALNNSGAYTANNSNTVTVGANLGGSGTLTMSGTGTLNLNGNNTYGKTTLNSGSLVAGTSTALGSGSLSVAGGLLDLSNNTLTPLGTVALTGGVITNGTLSASVNFTGSTNAAIGSVIADSGAGASSLTVNGNGTLALTGNNTFTGGSVLTKGTLQIAAQSALGSGITTVNGGLLDLQGSVLDAAVLVLNGGSVNNGVLTNDAGFSGLNAGTVNASLTGYGQLRKSSPGTLVLNGANDYQGATIIEAGALQSTFNSNTAAYVVSPGATLVATVGAVNPWTADQITTVASSMSNATIGVDASGNGAPFALSGLQNANGGVTLGNFGSGTLALTAGGDYSGVAQLSLNGGTIDLGGGTFTPTGAYGTNLFLGAGVLTNGAIVANKSIYSSLNGGTTSIAAVDLSGSGSLSKYGAGTLVLSGNNSHSGGTLVNNGTLVVASSTALGSGSVSIGSTGPTTVGTLDLGGTTLNADNQPLSMTAGVLTNGSVTANNALTNLSGGTIAAPITGAASIVKGGSGTLTLASANGYTGGTVVNAGALVMGNASALGSGSVTVSGGALNLGGNSVNLDSQSVSLTSGSITNGTVSSATSFDSLAIGTVSAALTGAGSLTHASGTLTLSGNNSYSGGSYINGGALVLGSSTANGTGPVVVRGGALDLGGFTNDVTTLKLTLNFGTVRNGTITSSGNFDGLAAGSGTVSAVLSGTGSLTVGSSSTLTLAGANGSWSGKGYLNGGKLVLGNSNAIGTGGLAVKSSSVLSASTNLTSAGGISVTNGATLTVDASGKSLGLAGGISGNGAVVVANSSNSGTVTLTGNNTFSGGLTVSGNGNASIASAGAVGFIATNTTLPGAVVIAGPSQGKNAYAAPNMPSNSVGTNYGYAQFQDGVSSTNLTVNGRLDIGNGSYALSGITGTANGNTNFVGGGSGAIVYSSTTSNTLGFASGGAFSGFFLAPNAVASLTQSGSGTTYFGTFGSQAGNSASAVPSNSQVTFNGGNWSIGSFGQVNSSQMAAGSFTVTNNAAITVGGNASGAHMPVSTRGIYNISQGSMNFLSELSSTAGGTPAMLTSLQINVGPAGSLNVLGNARFGNPSTGTVLSTPNALTIDGGLVSITGNLYLGYGASNGTTNDVVNVAVNSGSLSAGNIIAGTDSSSSSVAGQTVSLNLNSGAITTTGTLRAGTNTGQTSTFNWTGGTLSARTINATSSNWSGGNISGGALTQNAGTLAVSSNGTTVIGDYNLNGGKVTLAIGNGAVAVTGTATLGAGTLEFSAPNYFNLYKAGSGTTSIISAGTALINNGVTYNWLGGQGGSGLNGQVGLDIVPGSTSLDAVTSVNTYTSGDWSQSGSWSRGFVPNGQDYFALIGSSNSIYIDTNATVSDLRLGTGNTLSGTGTLTLTPWSSINSNAAASVALAVNSTNTISAPLALSGNAIVSGTNGSALNITGGLSGNGALTFNTGSFTLTGDTHAGGTILTKGTLWAGYNPNTPVVTVATNVSNYGASLIVPVASTTAADNWTAGTVAAQAASMTNASFQIDTTGTNFTIGSTGLTNAGQVLALSSYGTGTLSLASGVTSLAGVAKIQLNGNGGAFDLGGNNLTLSGASNTTTVDVYAGTLQNGTITTAGLIRNNSWGTNVTVISANLAGSGAYSKGGDGVAYLSGNNSFTGGATVNTGTLFAQSSTALGNGAVTVKGGSLDLGGNNLSIGGDFTMTGGGITNGSLTAANYNLSGGNVGSSLGEGIANVTGLSSNVVTVTGSLAATNVNISANGSLSLASSNALSTAATVNFGAAGDKVSQINTLDLNGQSLSLNGLTSTGIAKNLVTDTLGGSTLTLTGASAFAGSIGSGNLALNVASGTHSLTGVNTFTGATTIGSGAKLDLGTTGSLASTLTVNVNGGTLLLGADNQVNAAADLNLNGGTVSVGGAGGSASTVNQAFASLTLTANSIIDFNALTGSSFTITGTAALNGNSLKVYNWNSNDHLIFSLGSGSGISETDLGKIAFYSDLGNTLAGQSGGSIFGGLSGNEIVPVPEPGVVITGLLMVVWMLFAGRRRIAGLLTRRMA